MAEVCMGLRGGYVGESGERRGGIRDRVLQLYTSCVGIRHF